MQKFMLSLTENGAVLREDIENDDMSIVFKNYVDHMKNDPCIHPMDLVSGVTITRYTKN